MARILDGKAVRSEIEQTLIKKIKELGQAPGLLIVQVGDRPDSTVYIEQKKKFAALIGAHVEHRQLPESISYDELKDLILKANQDKNIHGIIVQLPLPAHLDPYKILNLIDQNKDIDGLTVFSIYQPATVRGVNSLLGFYTISIIGKDIVVIGKSHLVGRPLALSMMDQGATVTVCHKHTKDIKKYTKTADIIMVAAGAPGLITKDYVSSGQTIIDIGISRNPDPTSPQRSVGDVVFHEVEPIVADISPVPGGVGPLTVASLFQNLVDAFIRQNP